MSAASRPAPQAAILVVDDEVIVRSALAEYLRDCGYHVIEAANADEAITVLEEKELRVDAMLSAVELRGQTDGFGLARWVREHRKDVELILAGTPARAAASAADLCESGPELARPYEPQLVHDRIKRMLAGRRTRSG